MTENIEPSLLTESKSSKLILPSSQQLESQLQLKMSQMTTSQKCGDYVKAQKCKQIIEQLKKELHQKKLQEMNSKHRRQKRKMERCHEQQVLQLNTFWDKKLEQFKTQTQKMKKQMEEKHQTQLITYRTELQAQIPNKMKESSECLNLRKMEQQMAKQKKYAEAHKIQQRVIEMQAKQKQAFQKQRQMKIETALTQMKAKHKVQMDALMKRIKTGQNQQMQDKQTEIQKIKHKNTNAMKQLKSEQQKQVLAHKGQIKSKVTVSAVKSRSKLVPLKVN